MRVSSAAVRRAAVLVLVALAIATTCALLGRWQWNKHVARDALIATVDANWSAPAVPITQLVASPDQAPAASDEWRSVSMTGHYLADSAVLLRNRPVNGQPAYHVLVPFQADDGTVLVVDRGWVPVGNDAQRGADVPAPPSGTVTVVARLRVPEPPSDRSAPAGQVQNFSPEQALAAGDVPAGTAAYRWYAGLVSESPVPATPLAQLSTPSTDPGPYLSYGVQWWVFAVAALAAFGWMARREIVDDLAGRTPIGARQAQSEPSRRAPELVRTAPGAGAGVSADEPTPARASTPGPTPAPRRRRGRDELAEDALLDAQHPGPPS